MNKELFDKFTSGGGGPAQDRFVIVNLVSNPDYEPDDPYSDALAYTADHTIKQIYDASKAGKICVFVESVDDGEYNTVTYGVVTTADFDVNANSYFVTTNVYAGSSDFYSGTEVAKYTMTGAEDETTVLWVFDSATTVSTYQFDSSTFFNLYTSQLSTEGHFVASKYNEILDEAKLKIGNIIEIGGSTYGIVANILRENYIADTINPIWGDFDNLINAGINTYRPSATPGIWFEVKSVSNNQYVEGHVNGTLYHFYFSKDVAKAVLGNAKVPGTSQLTYNTFDGAGWYVKADMPGSTNQVVIRRANPTLDDYSVPFWKDIFESFIQKRYTLYVYNLATGTDICTPDIPYSTLYVDISEFDFSTSAVTADMVQSATYFDNAGTLTCTADGLVFSYEDYESGDTLQAIISPTTDILFSSMSGYYKPISIESSETDTRFSFIAEGAVKTLVLTMS